jgi:hypothetical protein
MSQLVAIHPHHHQHLRLIPEKAELHSKGIQLMPVVPAEFANIASQSPIVLTKNGDTGQFVFVAVLGFAPGENLWLQHEQWQGHYLPLQLQRQPFFLGQTDSGSDFALCIDLQSPMLQSGAAQGDNSQALFQHDGSDSSYFLQVKACLAELLRGEQQQQQLIQALLDCGLIQPLSLEITFANQQSTKLQGLYTIDQQKLAKLSQTQLYSLHQQGWLAAIYTVLASAAQFYPLIARKNQQLVAQ